MADNANSQDTIIIGGGLAGLSAAYHSGYPLYESQPYAGGTAASITDKGFVFDLGIHVLQSKNSYFLNLLKEIGVTLTTHERNGWIYSHNTFFPYPFQVNTSHLPILDRLQCILGFAFARQGGGRKPSNYAEWILQNFGAGFAKTFLTPYAHKFWCVPPEEMTFEWTGNRVPRPNFMEVFKGAFKNQETALGTHVVFQYPTNKSQGFGAIAQALADKLQNATYGMHATKIDVDNKVVLFNSGEVRVPYNKIISTIPLPDLVPLMPNVPTDVLKAVDALKCNSIASINLGVAQSALTSKHWIHFPEPHSSFFRISFPSNFSEGLAPQGSSSIQAEVAYRGERPDSGKLLRTVKDDLIKVGVISQSTKIISEDITFLPYGYVIYDHNRQQSVEKIHSYLQSQQIYPCGRYGAWEYLWSDQSILNGRDVARSLSNSSKD